MTTQVDDELEVVWVADQDSLDGVFQGLMLPARYKGFASLVQQAGSDKATVVEDDAVFTNRNQAIDFAVSRYRREIARCQNMIERLQEFRTTEVVDEFEEGTQ